MDYHKFSAVLAMYSRYYGLSSSDVYLIKYIFSKYDWE